jgi:hypothetical protein
MKIQIVSEIKVKKLKEKFNPTVDKLEGKSLNELAYIIIEDWRPVNYAAKPYLEAMTSLDSIQDNFGADTGYSVVAYFLSNANTWKGDVARTIKEKIKSL